MNSASLSTAAVTPFHTSTRTAVSVNTDPDTGRREQVLMTSQLELSWIAGELSVCCRSSRLVVNAVRTQRRVARTGGER